MSAKVSVIVPVYNAKKFLPLCINSIINQTYKNLEIILVDDGSLDKSGLICDRFAKKDSRIVVIHKENGGVSSARNTGMDISSGEYICFVDSDDWLHTKAIESLVGKISEDDSDFCVGQAECVGIIHYVLIQKLSDTYIEKQNFDKLTEIEGMLRAPWAKLYRKDIITHNNLIFPPNVAYGEDAIFIWNYLSCCNRVSTVGFTTYYYSQFNVSSASSKYYEQLADWQYLYFEKFKQTMTGCLLPKEVEHSTICKAAMSHTYACCFHYTDFLGKKEKVKLLEKIEHTINLFYEYLSDDILKQRPCLIKGHEALYSNILSKDYIGIADYCLKNLCAKKKNIFEQIVKKMALWCKKQWTYSFVGIQLQIRKNK